MNKHTLFTGFMLFALFFGAGNLIYPPTLGLEAGTSFLWAILGFMVTGVGLPIVAIAATALVKNDAAELGQKVHPLFGVIFISIIYLAIGPFFGIPRAANVAFEMGVIPFISDKSADGSFALPIYTLLFFGLVFWLSLNPSKLVNRIGQLLTPILLLAVTALSIGGFLLLDAPSTKPIEKYQSNPFFTGFVEGYLTMDAIGALAFGIIVITAFREVGVHHQRDMIRSTIKAGLVAGLALVLVYGSLGWIGVKMASMGPFANGSQILSKATASMFGSPGMILLGIIVILACFTTSIGLTVACAQFFKRTFNISYTSVVAVVTIASFLVANLGLNQIISISIPVLIAIYPIAIVLIFLAFFGQWFSLSSAVHRGAILLTAIVSVYEGLTAFGLETARLTPFIEQLPLFSLGLGWLVPALVGGLAGRLISGKK